MSEKFLSPHVERNREKIRPVFEAGSVAIMALGNLQIEPGRNLGRREDVRGGDFPAAKIRLANLAEISERKSTGNIGSPLRGEAFNVFVGIRDFRLAENTLTVDTVPVVALNYYRLNNDRNAETSLEVFGALGNAMVLLTQDGKLIVQNRSDKNRSYPGVIGASAAGMMDATMYDREERAEHRDRRGKMKPLTRDSLEDHVRQETFEEVQLTSEQLPSLVLAGFARDNRKPHYEMLRMAQSTLTAQQVIENAAVTSTGKEQTERHFNEEFFVLDGTPEAIFRLLTESNTPIPPTHSAAFIATMHHIIEQTEGLQAADRVLRELQPKLQAHLANIDIMVQEFYREHPAELHDRYKDEMPTGYDPKFLPQQQGLPAVQAELERLGLLTTPTK